MDGCYITYNNYTISYKMEKKCLIPLIACTFSLVLGINGHSKSEQSDGSVWTRPQADKFTKIDHFHGVLLTATDSLGAEQAETMLFICFVKIMTRFI